MQCAGIGQVGIVCIGQSGETAQQRLTVIDEINEEIDPFD